MILFLLPNIIFFSITFLALHILILYWQLQDYKVCLQVQNRLNIDLYTTVFTNGK